MATSVARHHVQLVADTSQFEKGIESSSTALARFEKAQKSAASGISGLGGSQATLHVTKELAVETNRVATAQARIFDNLGLRIPQAAKSAEASMQAFNLEISRGSQIMKRSEMRMGGMGHAFAKGSKGASRFGMMVQQGGYQIQDFTVQVMGGQSALVAFAQQGSQFAGIFGPTGAMVGAGLAIGAVIAKMALLRNEVNKVTVEYKTQKEAVDALLVSKRELALTKVGIFGTELDKENLSQEFNKKDLDEANDNYATAETELARSNARLKDILDDREILIRDAAKAGTSTGGALWASKGLQWLANRDIEAAKLALTTAEKNLNKYTSVVLLGENDIKKAKESEAEAEKQRERDALSNKIRILKAGLKVGLGADRDEIAASLETHKIKLDLLEEEGKAIDKLADARKRAAQDVFDRTRTPLERFKIEVGKLQDLFRTKDIDQEQLDRGILLLAKNAESAIGDTPEASTPEQDKLDALADKMTEFEKISAQMWNSVSDRASQSFADMVLTGQSAFDKLAEIVARAMLEIAARMAIVNPLMNLLGANALGGSLLPAWFGAGKVATTATGGSIWKGETRMVGEAGPELITAQKGGQIMANSARKSSNSAPIYNLNYTFNGGVTPQDLGRAIPQIVQMTKRAVSESNSRWQPV